MMLTIKVEKKGTTISAEGSVGEIMNDSARAIKAIHEALKNSDNEDIFKEFIKFTVYRDDFWEKSAKEEPKEEEKAEPKDDKDEADVPDSIKGAIAEVLKWIAQ